MIHVGLMIAGGYLLAFSVFCVLIAFLALGDDE